MRIEDRLIKTESRKPTSQVLRNLGRAQRNWRLGTACCEEPSIATYDDSCGTEASSTSRTNDCCECMKQTCGLTEDSYQGSTSSSSCCSSPDYESEMVRSCNVCISTSGKSRSENKSSRSSCWNRCLKCFEDESDGCLASSESSVREGTVAPLGSLPR
jgi:hypothetical protein